MFDTHFHALEMSRKGLDVANILHSAKRNGLKACVEVAIDTNNFLERVKLADCHNGMRFSAGLHPNSCERGLLKHSLNCVREQCNHPLVTSVGETGLDYYRDWTPIELQKEAFSFHLDLAVDMDMPVIVHNREADDDVLKMIEESDCRSGVLHCFSSGKKEAQRALDLGFHISFGGPLTFKRNHKLREVAAMVPLDSLLIETDSPYLSPEPMRGKTNTPNNLHFIFETLCSVRSENRDVIALSLCKNAEALFKVRTGII